VASFVCSDAPTFVDICTLAAQQQEEEAAAAAIIAVVTSKGHLILFQHYFESDMQNMQNMQLRNIQPKSANGRKG
jgi:glutamine amidotransferase-like uncharacterized protein